MSKKKSKRGRDDDPNQSSSDSPDALEAQSDEETSFGDGTLSDDEIAPELAETLVPESDAGDDVAPEVADTRIPDSPFVGGDESDDSADAEFDLEPKFAETWIVDSPQQEAPATESPEGPEFDETRVPEAPPASMIDDDDDVAPELAETWVPESPNSAESQHSISADDDVAPELAETVVPDGPDGTEIDDDSDTHEIDEAIAAEFADTWIPESTPPESAVVVNEPDVEDASSADDATDESDADEPPDAIFRKTVSLHGRPFEEPPRDRPRPDDFSAEFAATVVPAAVPPIGGPARDSSTATRVDSDDQDPSDIGKATVIGGSPSVAPNDTVVGEGVAEKPASKTRAATSVAGTRAAETRTAASASDHTIEERLNVQRRPVSGSPFADNIHADYEVLSQIGQGAMGVVYSARQAALNREVTFKTLKSWWESYTSPLRDKLNEEQYFKVCQQLRESGSLSDDMTGELKSRVGDEEIERLSLQLRTVSGSLGGQHRKEQWKRDLFLSEAVVTGNLVHPNIIPIHDMGKMDDGTLFYSMKWVHGTPWDKRIESMSLRENLDVLLSMCDAIAFAHHKGIINRDLKPENVMLGHFGEVLVLDWGLAIATPAFDKKDDITTQSRPGSGTPIYMAPELLNGPMEKIGTWSDIYLLGAILFEIATGQPPHDFSGSVKMKPAERRMQIFKIVGENQIRDPGTSGELLDIAMKSLNTDPSLRHQSVLEFKEAILDYLRHAESLKLSRRADELMSDADEHVAERGYNDYQTASALYEESLREWPENSSAATGLDKTRRDYAQAAYKKGDYDLGLHVLEDQTDPDSEQQKTRLRRARRNRQGMKYAIVGSLATILIGGSAAYWKINKELDLNTRLHGTVTDLKQEATRIEEQTAATVAKAERDVDEAEAKRIDADKERQAAEDDKMLALQAKDEAEEATTMAEMASMKAEAAAKVAKRDATLAKEEKEEAVRDATLAKAAKEEADKNAKLANQAKESAYEAAKAAKQQQRLAEFRSLKTQADGYIQIGQYSEAVTILRRLLEKKDNEFARRNREPIQRTLEKALRNASSTQLPVETGAVSRDGKTLVIGQNNRVGRSARILIRNVAEIGQNPSGQREIKFNGELKALALSPNGQVLAASVSNRVRLWNLSDNREQPALKVQPSAMNSLAFSSDGKSLFVGDQRGLVRAVNLGTRRIVGTARFGSAVKDLVLFPDNSVMLTALSRGRQSICVATRVQSTSDSVKFTRMGQLSLPIEDRVPISHLAIARDASWLAISNSRDGNVFVFPRRRSSKTGEFPFVGGSDLKHGGWKLAGHTRTVNSLAFSADGTQLVTGSDDYTLGVWKLSESASGTYSFKRTHTLIGHGGAVEECEFLPQHRDRVVSMSRDHFVRVWDLNDYKQQRDEVLKSIEEELIQAASDPRRGTTYTRFTVGRNKPGADPAFDAGHPKTLIHTLPDRRYACSGPRLATFQQPGRPEIVIDGHNAGVLSARFNRDGSRLLTASRDQTARAWDTETASSISDTTEKKEAVQAEVFDEGDVYNVTSLLFFPDGRKLLTSAYGSISLWDVQPGTAGTGYELATLTGVGVYSAAAISSDGKLILTSAPENTARLWKTDDVITSRQPRPFRVLKGSHKFSVTAVAVSPDGRLLATGARRGKLVIWNTATARPVSVHVGAHGDQVSAIRFLSSDQLLTAGFDGQIKAWNVSAAGQSSLQTKFKKVSGFVTLLETSPDAKRFIAAVRTKQGRDWTTVLRMWKVDQPDPIRTFDMQTLHGSKPKTTKPSNIDANSISWSADGSRVAVTTDNVLTILDAESAKVVSRLIEQTGRMASAQVAFRPTADQSEPKHLVTSDEVSTHLWDLKTGRHVVSFRPHASVYSSAWSADERFVVTASRSIRIFNAQDGAASGRSLFKIENPHDGPVSYVEFSPDRTAARFVSVSLDGTAHIWQWNADERTIKLLRSLKTEREHIHINHVTWSPDGSRILTVSDDGRPRLWTLDDSQPPQELPTNASDGPWNGLCAAFSSDEKWVAVGGVISASEQSTGYVWDLSDTSSPKLHCRIEGHGQGGITALRFTENDTDESAANRFLITGGHDGAVYKWDWIPDGLGEDVTALNVFTFARPGSNEAHLGQVTSIDTTTDGRIVTASEDGTAVIWRQFQR